MRLFFLTATLCSVAIGLPLTANADEPETTAGGTCVPLESTIADANYNVNYGAIEFKTGQTGELQFICPVTSLADGSYDIYNWYSNDDDGSSEADYYVRTIVRRRSKTAGTNTTLCDYYSDGTGHDSSSSSGIAIDTDTYLYYVYVFIWRDTTQTNSIRFNALSWVPSV